jgi:purine-binding chemotaxis protein CheW
MSPQLVASQRTGRPLAPDRRCFTIVCEDRSFGLPVEHIQTVFEITSVTPVPLAPAEVIGLVNLRGKIVTAVSLRRRLRGADVPETSRLAIGLDFRGESFALVVDEVGDVIALAGETEIDTPPHLGAERAKITAVYRLAGSILPILDLHWVFSFGDKP